MSLLKTQDLFFRGPGDSLLRLGQYLSFMVKLFKLVPHRQTNPRGIQPYPIHRYKAVRILGIFRMRL